LIPDSGRKADQHNSRTFLAARVHQRAEILIFSQQNAVFRMSDTEDEIVFCSGSNFSDCCHVVSRSTQSPHNSEIAAFVGQETHPLVPTAIGFGQEYYFFVGKQVGSISDRSMNILTAKAWIGIEQISMGRTLT
jgi:hypothetical protein